MLSFGGGCGCKLSIQVEEVKNHVGPGLDVKLNAGRIQEAAVPVESIASRPTFEEEPWTLF